MEYEELIEKIVHSPCEKGLIEETNKNGIKLDGSTGLSVKLGFGENQLSKADYLILNNDLVEIVELSDLSNQVQLAQQAFEKLKHEFVGALPARARLTKRDERKLRKSAFSSIKSELAQKWCGSIASFERLSRLNEEVTKSPEYSYTIVCKNDGDLRALDCVTTMMQGMCGNFRIVNSDIF